MREACADGSGCCCRRGFQEKEANLAWADTSITTLDGAAGSLVVRGGGPQQVGWEEVRRKLVAPWGSQEVCFGCV